MRVIYASSTQSLAALETLVHLNPPVTFKYVLFQLEFATALVEVFPRQRLPAGWRNMPAPGFTRTLGDICVRASR